MYYCEGSYQPARGQSSKCSDCGVEVPVIGSSGQLQPHFKTVSSPDPIKTDEKYGTDEIARQPKPSKEKLELDLVQFIFYILT